MSVRTILQELAQDAVFRRNVTVWHRLPAQPARCEPLPPEVDQRLATALRGLGIPSLYAHQAAAWRAAQEGRSFVVVTATASGKSLCYHLPILDDLLRDSTSRALYLFPTKALAQDQLASLQALEQQLAAQDRDSDASVPLYHLYPGTYDGDTPQHQRSRIRSQARLLLTNPDMLHAGILPHHTQWAAFFSQLRYVVLDELHTYRGVFGSHVANVLRRLRRICGFYGSEPQVFSASATIANPLELAQRLLEMPLLLIDQDGAPKGERHILFYNPPLVDAELGLRRASALEAEAIAGRLLDHAVQTVIFARARLTVEVLLTYLRERMAGIAIRGYRSGYLPEERREIEQGLRAGTVRAVVATNALELGVNIGGLDAAVLAGFPGTIASTWQQAGRAGRRGDVSLAILVATAGALDQYVISHPDYFFQRSPEHALINPDNLAILANHLACAAFELPFRAGERFGQVEFTEELLAYLADSGEVQQHGGDWFWMGEGYPAQAISLRTASPDNVVIQVPGQPEATSPSRVIGQLERAVAPSMLHEGAVYLHEGESYLVERLDWEPGQAWVVPVDVGYYTRATASQQVTVQGVQSEASQGGVYRAYGPVRVTSRVSGYRQIRLHTHETLGYGQVDLPDQVLETDAYWMAFTDELLEPLRASGGWRSDPNDYGPNWQQQRQAARARDGYRCQACGVRETTGRPHDVHHQVPFRAFGYMPGINEHYRQANQLENLVTLCRSCHRRVEQGQRLRTGLGGLAYVLGSLAPLHLMCDAGDIGVVAEAAAPGSGLPTITIYERVPAGIGFSQRLFELHDELLWAAAGMVRQCPCRGGCPACVGPLGQDQAPLLDPKALTLALLDAIVAGERELLR